MEDSNQSTRPLVLNAITESTEAEGTKGDPLPHHCQLCKQLFSDKYHLNRHLKRCHTDVNKQPHQCHACPKAFAYKSDLKRHVQYIHNEDRPYKCTKCEFKTKCQGNLNQHMKSHDENRECFNCSKCDKNYASKWRLRNHFKKIHGSLKNEDKTENDYSLDISKTSGYEEDNHGEESGEIVQASTGDISLEIFQSVQDEYDTVENPTTEPAPGSGVTTNEVQVAVWECYCGNIYFSHDDFEKHWNEVHITDDGTSEAATGNVSGEFSQEYSSSFASAQQEFLSTTSPTLGPTINESK